MTAVLGIFDLFYTALLVLWTFWVNFITDFLQDIAALSEWFFSAALLTAAILLLRWLLRDKLSCRVRYALWLVVLARLLLPVQLSLPLPVTGAQLAPAPSAALEEPILVLPDFFPAPQPIQETEIDPDKLTPSTEVEAENSPSLNAMSGEDILLFVWKSGAGAVLAVLLLSNARFDLWLTRRRRRLELPDVPLPVYLVEGLSSPCLFGLFRPAVYLTPEAAENEVMRRHVLTHELTHYAHRDHIWAVLRCLCLVIHWFDPLVWAAAILSKRDCELACDEGAVSRLGEGERIPYGRTLVDMVAQNSRAHLLSCSTTMTGGKKTIQQRIERLVNHPETKTTALFLAVSLVTVAAVFTFAGDEPTAKELGIPTSETAYTRFLEQLDTNLPMSFNEVSSPYDSYIPATGVDGIRQIKTLLLERHIPLSVITDAFDAAEVTSGTHSLNLYYDYGDGTFGNEYYFVAQNDLWYICLEDWDWNEHRWFIPVATIDEGVLSDLESLIQNQKSAASANFSLDQFKAALNGLFHVTVYDSRVDIDTYAFFLTITQKQELDTVKQLLAAACTPIEDNADIPRKPTPNYILLDTDADSSPAPEYTIRSFEDYGSILYRTVGTNTPIARVPDEVVTELITLADPEREPRVVMGISILGSGNTRYELADAAAIAQLSQLLLRDPDTVEQNRHPCYDMTDWLTNWTTRCFVEYGVPLWSHNRTERWFIRAMADSSSFYHIDIPDHLVDAVLAVCAPSDS